MYTLLAMIYTCGTILAAPRAYYLGPGPDDGVGLRWPYLLLLFLCAIPSH